MNIMLTVQEKNTTYLDLYRPLRHYISGTFSECDAQNCNDDLLSVHEMRSNLRKPITESSLDSRRDLLLSYYKSLSLIEPRFTIPCSFTWYDAFKPSKKSSGASIHVEKAAILFNLGAIYSQIAKAADRTTAYGLKIACNTFQSAAGAFAYLKENVAGKATAAGATVDLSPECAEMLESLMLAQAQECFFEKVIRDEKRPGLCSKVARQVGLYYEEAFALLRAPPLDRHFDETWVAHVQLKAAQFYGEALYRHSLELHEKEEIAEEISSLKIGLAALDQDTKKISKGVAAPLLDAISKLKAIMTNNLERATKENGQVYQLSSLPGVSLVKPSSMAELLDASKERIFSGLVPDESMKAFSKYTEMVDEIIPTQREKLQLTNEINRVRLKEIDSILSLEGVRKGSTSTDRSTRKISVAGTVDSWEINEKLEAKEMKKEKGKNKDKEKEENEREKEKDKGKEKLQEMPESSVVLKIKLHCEDCINRIYHHILLIKGVKDVAIDTAKDLVTVKGTMDAISLPALLKEKLKRSIEVVAYDKKDDSKEQKEKSDKSDDQKASQPTSVMPYQPMSEGSIEPMVSTRLMDPIGPMGYISVAPTRHMRVPTTEANRYDPIMDAHEMFSDENPNACSVI